MNIVLIGFTASGKTSVGRKLASTLDLEFHDLDTETEAAYFSETGRKLSCREIFSEFGRTRFSQLEGIALEKLRTAHNMILSTGGGVITDPSNRRALKSIGTVIYLHADHSRIFERMRARGFPAYLGHAPSMTDVEAAWRERDPLYREVADIVVNNSHDDIDATVGEIRRQIAATTGSQD